MLVIMFYVVNFICIDGGFWFIYILILWIGVCMIVFFCGILKLLLLMIGVIWIRFIEWCFISIIFEDDDEVDILVVWVICKLIWLGWEVVFMIRKIVLLEIVKYIDRNFIWNKVDKWRVLGIELFDEKKEDVL